MSDQVVNWGVSDRAQAVHRQSLVWDAHACLPLLPGQGMAALGQHRAAGVSDVSINVAMDFNPIPTVMRVIAAFRAWIAEHSDQYLLPEGVEDLRRAKHEGKVAVGFDLEGSVMLDDDLSMLR